MNQKLEKPPQFRLRGLFKTIALVAVVAAVLARASTSVASPISVLFPIAATVGVLMVLAAVRDFSTE
jgi:hypothetical protein